MNTSYVKGLIGIILLLTIFVNIFTVLFSQKEKYLSHNYWQKFSLLKQMYEGSQYVSKHPEGWIPDEIVLSYAGGALIRGTNPVYIIPDTPPLGKYLIGISTIIFQNENMETLIFALLSLVLLYLVGRQIFSSSLTALCPVVFVSFEPIFKNQLIYTPLLDIIQLVFLLSCFYFFNKAIMNKGKKESIFFLLVCISLGIFISIKFFITGLTILAALYVVLLFHRQQRKIILLTSFLPISILILLGSYSRVLVLGYSVRSLLGIQKWVFLYHKSQLILPFSIWPLLFLNRWYVWYGNKPIISDAQWNFTWPIIGIISFLTILFYVLKKMKQKISVEVLFAWVIAYILFFSVGQISSRYLVIYIPVLYLVSIFGIEQYVIMLYKRYYK